VIQKHTDNIDLMKQKSELNLNQQFNNTQTQ